MPTGMHNLSYQSFLAALLFLLSFADLAQAISPPFPDVPPGSVFSSSEPLSIEVEAPLAKLFAHKAHPNFLEVKKQKVPGVLRYLDGNGQKVEVAIQLKIKGFSSINTCNFPKMELKIDKLSSPNTIFQGIKSIDLNTHCDHVKPEKRALARLHNHREELLYQMARALEIPTFESRPLWVRYKNSGLPEISPDTAYQAFFLEDMGALEKRLAAVEIKSESDILKDHELARNPTKTTKFSFRSVVESQNADPEDAARIALFQALIGNVDWYISPRPGYFRFQGTEDRLWNVKILELPHGKWVLLPNDFNLAFILSGTVFPRVDSDIYNTVDREAQRKIEEQFISKKPELDKLIERLSTDPEGRTHMKTVLDAFYAEIARWK